ncbi:MAG: DNA polymerase, partial [Clostridia bacterium]
FERVCLSRFLGHWLDPAQWHCSAVMASYLTLPPRLGDAAIALNLAQKKRAEGKDLIRYFSIPCKATKVNGGRTRNLPEHAPDKWAVYKAYNAQDVETERAVRKALEKHPLPDYEWELYALDQRINDRGVRVDKLLVKQAMRVDQVFSAQAFLRAKELTGLENPGSVSQLKAWLADQDMPMESLAKKIVQEKAKDAEGIVGELLNLRLELSKTSVKKYEAMARTVCRDGRIHGLLQFGGASRTMRWAGRLVQAQNLPQNHLPDLSLAREIVKTGDEEQLELLFGSVPNTLSELIRTAFIPKDGCRFIVADFSAIEARVLAWLAGEEWVLEEFEGRGKIYEATAARMFSVPAETIVKGRPNYEYRQKGKQATLSCVAQGQLVLTDYGLVPIERVTIDHRVWDGEEWVHHDGVVYRGRRAVITHDGLTATPDHLVWIEGQSEPIQFGIAASSGAHLTITEHCGQAIRLGENHQPGKALEQEMESLPCADRMHILPQHSVDASQQSDSGDIEGLSELFGEAQTDPYVARPKADGSETTLRESKRSPVSALWGEGHQVQLPLCYSGGHLDSEECARCAQGVRNGSNKQRWQLRTGQYTICLPGRELRKSSFDGSVGMESRILALLQKCCHAHAFGGENTGGNHRVCAASRPGKAERLADDRCTARLYDIRNAGPHHRFTVSGRLVHNCGYGGGVGALKAMNAAMPEDEMQPLVDAWRAANPRIVAFWGALDRAAREVIEEHTSARVGKVALYWQDDRMFIRLPGGRNLCYISPRFVPNRFGNSGIGYLAPAANGQLVVQETFGGKIAENVTQSIARDLLAHGMMNLETAGYPINFHVHDEAVMEVPIGQGSVEEACEIMARAPAWAEGLPLRADGDELEYYRKS